MLRNNRISCIHNDSFTGLRNVRLLSLYDNQISTIAPGAFDTLQSLSTLYVGGPGALPPPRGCSQTTWWEVEADGGPGPSAVPVAPGVQEVQQTGGGCPRSQVVPPPAPPMCRNLLANPFNCNCQLAWLGDWLRKRKIVTGNPRCQNPDFLRQIPLQDVAFPDFRCEEGNSHPPVPAPSPVLCQPPAPHGELGSPPLPLGALP